MTNSIVPSITDEQLADIEQYVNTTQREASEVVNSDIAAIIARLRAAEADAKRLEWMINEGCIVQYQNGTSSPTVFRVYWPSLAEQQPEWYATERAAIDAAMERTP